VQNTTDLLMRPSPFIRSFGDMSSSIIDILISIGRSVSITTLEPSEFGPGRLVASALRSEAGLHHTTQGGGLLHLLKTFSSMVLGFDVLLLISLESEPGRVVERSAWRRQ
jgi:hypothetical protein